MCAYTDVTGWQNKQFLGRGEFPLPFGDYDVKITVPSDHMVGSTGQLMNEKKVLSPTELQRLERARNTFDAPVLIVTEEEARAKEQIKKIDTRTWHFQAENVRDFAFASSHGTRLLGLSRHGRALLQRVRATGHLRAPRAPEGAGL